MSLSSAAMLCWVCGAVSGAPPLCPAGCAAASCTAGAGGPAGWSCPDAALAPKAHRVRAEHDVMTARKRKLFMAAPISLSSPGDAHAPARDAYRRPAPFDPALQCYRYHWITESRREVNPATE